MPWHVSTTVINNPQLPSSQPQAGNAAGQCWVVHENSTECKMNVSGGKGYEQKDNKGHIYNADKMEVHHHHATDSVESEKITSLDWRKLCGAMLKHQQESQRLRRKVTEMGCEVNVHVPLGLVERKQQARRGMDENCQLNEVYRVEKEAIAQIYQHDEFLQQVIGQTPTGKNKHVAIIG
ncbi:hypothetical protein [Scytonema sp. HK-05]|uniref:hypothetical protein n=1 Tax=Scytonema sp. HK-05 TaxID=1137095 RepID=UPI00130197F1|nr:hypothetical protein [Scytonema sp. HK-05]